MTAIYSGDSPIIGIGRARASQIDGWFEQVGRALAPRYAPDGMYRPAPKGLGEAIIAWSGNWRGVTVNSDLVAAQCAKESAGWQSSWARDANNPAGLGVDGRPGMGERFDSFGEGLECQVAHLLVYAVGEGQWTARDRRYEAAKAQGYLGIAPTLRGLNGRWATPGPTYGEEIAGLANDLLEFGGGMGAQVAGFAWVPETAGEYGYPTGTHGRNGVAIDRLIIHCTLGTDSPRWLTGGNGNSVHFLLAADGSPRAQMVALEDAAWGAGNRGYNLRGVNVEIEATEALMLAPAFWTDERIGKIAGSCAAILRNPLCAGILPDRSHVIGHAEVPDQDHTDPGPVFPWDRFMAALVGEMNRDDGVRVFPETGHGIGHGFRAYWEQFGDDAQSIRIFGYPLTEELSEDGRTVQYFERARFEFWPENPEPHRVLLSRLGADALAAR